MIGGGPTLYKNYDLRKLSGDGLAAAVVIGLSTVELVRFGEDPPRVVPLEAPPREHPRPNRVGAVETASDGSLARQSASIDRPGAIMRTHRSGRFT